MVLLFVRLGSAKENAQLELQGVEAAPGGGSDTTEGVYVRDSVKALDNFVLGERMERLKEWNKAADVFQEILEKYSDQVVQSKTDQNGHAYQYKSVTIAVQERLAHWPAEGLRVYKARFEPAAQAMLEGAKRDDYETLHKVFSLYFATDSGKKAGLRLIDLYLENGEFAAAAWMADRLLAFQPDLAVERPRVLYRAALAYHLSGDETRARQKMEELKVGFANATGTIRGKDVNLEESLQTELGAARPAARTSTADSWPIFMGDEARSRVSSGQGRTGARAFVSVELAKAPVLRVRRPGMEPWAPEAKAGAEVDSAALGVMPVVDRNELYFSDGSDVYAVSLESGLPLPQWQQTYPDKMGRYAAFNTPAPRHGQYTVTVTDDSVLAVLGTMSSTVTANPWGGIVVQQGPGGNVPTDREARLVCLERATGKLRWSVLPRQELTGEALQKLTLCGSPVVVGDNVYITGRGGKSAQFEDCYVLCFDLHSGKYRWSCYVASANTGVNGWAGEVSMPAGRTISHLAYASGRLYCLTNVGAVAAIDAYSGSIIWLNIYPRISQQNSNMMGGMSTLTYMRTSRPWSTNPAVVQDGKVFCLPSDGSELLVYDAADGSVINALHLVDCGNANTLVGVSGDKLVVTGNDVRCMNWKTYESSAFGRGNPTMLLWASAAKSPPIMGRAFMTNDSVFVATHDHAYRFDMTTGKVVEVYPTAAEWRTGEGEGPGNIVVTSDKVVIAGANRVNVYTDLAVATKRLDREIAETPNDPEPRLRYADVMFVSDKVPAAMARLDEAINLNGGLNAMKPGANRDRVYATAMTFAQKLANRRPTATTPRPAGTTAPTDEVNEFFDRAAAAASTPAQQVNYRAARARWAHQSGDFALEVRLYQEMLSDAALRNVQVSDEDRGAVVTAADLAEQHIAAVIASGGAQWYRPYEQEARQALDLARAKADPAELLGIAQRYPNSSSATAAMIAAAEGYESSANPRQATQLLREMYRKHPDSADREKLLEAMARNYLLLPGHLEVAIGRLAQAARVAPEQKLHAPLKTLDGQTIADVTYAAAADALKKILAQKPDGPALPDFALPTPPESRKAQGSVAPFKPGEADSVIAPVTSLVMPVQGFARFDRIVTFTTNSGVSIHTVGQNKPLAVNSTLAGPPLGCAWIGDNVLIFSGSEIALLRAESGNAIWKTALKSIPEAEMAPGAVENAVIANDGNGQQRIFVAGGGQLIINGAFQGRVVRGARGQFILQPAGNAAQPQPANGPEQIASVRLTGDRVIAATNTGRLFALDLPEGRLAWQYRVSRDHLIDRLLATDDFTVAKVTEDTGVQLIALDSASGQVIRRTNFTPETGNVPLNVLLSPGGMMVYSMPDRLAAKDLFEPGATTSWEAQCQPIGSRPFEAMTQPDQMTLANGRIAALCDTGASVRLYALDNGQELKPQGPGAEMSVPWITTKATSAAVALHAVGSHLYILNASALMSYDLDQALSGNGASAGQELVKDPDVNLADMFVGSDYLIAISTSDEGGARTRLLAYRRALVGQRESGLLDYDPAISDGAGIETWQPVNGGLYYLTKDHKLHFLAGARR